MSQIVTEVYDAFRAARVDDGLAKAAAAAIAGRDDLASKLDLERAAGRLQAEIVRFEADLRTEIVRVETDLRAEIMRFETDLRACRIRRRFAYTASRASSRSFQFRRPRSGSAMWLRTPTAARSTSVPLLWQPLSATTSSTPAPSGSTAPTCSAAGN